VDTLKTADVRARNGPRVSSDGEIIRNPPALAVGRFKNKTLLQNDLFAADVPPEYILRILAHCSAWPANTYVFQTKNPARYMEREWPFPAGSIFGTTIETNHDVFGFYLHQTFVCEEPLNRSFKEHVTA